jgi:hypothetical protein
MKIFGMEKEPMAQRLNSSIHPRQRHQNLFSKQWQNLWDTSERSSFQPFTGSVFGFWVKKHYPRLHLQAIGFRISASMWVDI